MPFRTKLVLAHVLLLVVATIAVLALRPGGDVAAPAAIQLAGRLHLLVLHVPIGVLAVVLVAEALTFTRHREIGDTVVAFTLPLLVLSGVGALVFGLCLAHGATDYPLAVVTKHRNGTFAGIALAILTGMAFPYRRGRAVHRVLLAATAAALTLGAHYGGSLTHGSDYLFAPVTSRGGAHAEPMDPADAGAADPVPTGIEADASMPSVPEDAGPPDGSGHDASPPGAGSLAVEGSHAVDAGRASAPTAARDAGAAPKGTSRAAVQAMLVRRCGPCHTERSKGGLRVTDLAAIKAADIVAGKPDQSELYTRLVLPKDSDDRMPPIDKPQPTAAELAALRAWITELGTAP